MCGTKAMRHLAVFLLYCVHVSVAVPSDAATLSPLNFPEPAYGAGGARGVWVILEAEIVPGDDDKFYQLAKKAGPRFQRLILNSPGGDVATAMRIGREVRKFLLTTEAPIEDEDGTRKCRSTSIFNVSAQGGCDCSSACFLIWSAGIKRAGNVIGIHRPRFDQILFRNLTILDAEAKYNQIAMEVGIYLAELEISSSHIERMLQMPSDVIEYIARDEIRRDFGGMAIGGNYIASIDEWLLAKCGR